MAVIKTTTSEEVKEVWENLCERQKISSASMLRKLILHVTKDQVSGKTKKTKKTKEGTVQIRFEPKDINLIIQRAREEGFENRSQWIRSLVLNTLDKQPVLTSDEIYAIREANRELAAIGRNLNQIARVLNIDMNFSAPPSQELLVGIAKTINKQQKKIMSLVDKSLNRWEEE